MVLGMGKMTDTFVEYDILKTLATGPDWENRHAFYNKYLIGKTGQDYYDTMKKYYNETEPVIPDIQPDIIKNRLSYSVSKMVEVYNDSIFNNGSLYVDNFSRDSTLWSLGMGGVALLFGICNFIMVLTFSQAAKNQVYQLKLRFFRSILQQEMSWYDTKKSGDFATKITA